LVSVLETMAFGYTKDVVFIAEAVKQSVILYVVHVDYIVKLTD
jgi:hypothetical protein